MSKLNNPDKHQCCHHEQAEQCHLAPIIPSSAEVLTTLKVTNMDCADEIKAINEALRIDGIYKVQANLMASSVQIVHSPEVKPHFLKKRIETTVVRVVNETHSQTHGQNRNRILIVAISGLLLFGGLALQWIWQIAFIEKILFFLSILFGGSLVFPKAIASLKRKSLDMNVLMTIATIGAVAVQEFSEAAAVVFLFSLSELLESQSVQRARRAITELLKIAPQKASIVESDSKIYEIDVSQVQLSQIVRVKAGESIPLDGVVVAGESAINQAPLTGESIPVLKTTGEPVFAGTINQEGSLDIKVTKLFSDSKISQVLKLIEEAQSQRAVSQKFVDKFAQIYTPTVMLLALVTFVIPPLLFHGSWHEWLYKALVLLVIACPCALVLSTPVSLVSSLTALAKKGILVKGGAILETIGKIKALAIDKTGTLTEGKPTVLKIIPVNSTSELQILEIAKSLEAHSTHPLAQAIVQFAESKQVATQLVDKFTNVTGRGVEAVISEHHYLLGNHRYAHETGICTPELELILKTLEEQALSVVVVGHKPHGDCNGKAMGVIALGDKIKDNCEQSLRDLQKADVKNIVVLSGDNQKTVSAIGKQLGLNELHGDLLPEDKVQYIETLKAQYQTVAMIGDGINDAPAMAKSSVGIAMGFAGSDTAIETADMTLMTDDLTGIATAVLAGRRTLGVIRFNIAFALVTKIVFLVLTFAGYSNLWLAVAADTGASILVILNSLRLLKLK